MSTIKYSLKEWKMKIENDALPSKKSRITLKALERAVRANLKRKELLGHYAVIWDGEKIIETKHALN